MNKISATNLYHRLRQIIHERLAEEADELAGQVEMDESYFGGVRKGKRGRDAVRTPEADPEARTLASSGSLRRKR